MNLGTMEQRTEGMKRQAQELIEFAYQRGVKAGHEEMKNQMHEHWGKKQKELIEQGRNEAWEAARKIESYCGNNKPLDEMFGEHGVADIERHFTASEAIEKIRAYEEQKKQEEDSEFRIGDEVERKTVPGKLVIHSISKIYANCMDCDGGQWTLKFEDIRKTGRHFTEIAEVLKKMQEGE